MRSIIIDIILFNKLQLYKYSYTCNLIVWLGAETRETKQLFSIVKKLTGIKCYPYNNLNAWCCLTTGHACMFLRNRIDVRM